MRNNLRYFAEIVFLMSKNFVILAHPRSGSTTLFNIFASQGVKIICEPFNSHSDTNYLDFWGKNGFTSALDLIF